MGVEAPSPHTHKQTPTHTYIHKHTHTNTHTFLSSKKEKGKQRKRVKVPKKRLLKGCHQGQNVLAISSRPTVVTSNTFQCFMALLL